MVNDFQQLKDFLDKQVDLYNRPGFIQNDPILIPHQYSKAEDIEIAGFFAAMLAWGQRVTIINKSLELLQLMDNSPYDFIIHAQENDLKKLETFVHRTFQSDDCLYFVYALKQIYLYEGGLETVFTKGYSENKSIKEALAFFREVFFSYPHLHRTRKHISDSLTGSAAKRLNMYLRWMVRNDSSGVDFGLWKTISMSNLMCPLDVHTAAVSRSLGLLSRKANDWQAVEELTARLREFDALDPIKYDFALFGTGVSKTSIIKL